jgi:type IX secretion system PorP/SprF family membrane protein
MKVFIFLMLFCFAFQSLIAQDLSNSVFSSSPLTLNPAATGTFGNSNLRVHGAFNWNTYGGFSSKVHKNFMSISADKTLLKGKLGIGGDVSYEFGNDIVKHKGAMLSAAYNKGFLNDNVTLSIGMQAGLMQNSYDWDLLVFDQPLDPRYEPIIPDENLQLKDHVLYPDFNLGMLVFRNTDNNKIMPWFGLSVSHLFRPDISYVSEFSSRLSRKLTLQAGTDIPVNAHIVLTPLLLFTKQDIFKTFDVGGSAKYHVGRFSISAGSIYKVAGVGNSFQHQQNVLAEIGYAGFELRMELLVFTDRDFYQPRNSSGMVALSWNLRGGKNNKVN